MVAVLVGWVYESTSSVAQVALLMAIRLVPPIVGGGVAASLVDRLPRQRVLVWSEAACAATIAGALFGVMAGSRPIVFAFVGLCGLVGMVSTVAGNALIPMVVEQDELPAANGIHSVGQEAAMALGAVGGGLTLAVGGATAGLAANLVELRHRRASLLPDSSRRRRRQPRGWQARWFGRGSSLRARQPSAWRSWSEASQWERSPPASSTPRCRSSRLTSASAPGGYGWALGVLGCGMIAGEALTGAIAERIEPRWLAAGLAGMGCLFFVFAWSGSTLVALLALAAFGVANGFTEVVMMTAIHQEAAATYQGRVFGIGSTVWRTTMLGAVALAPAINAIASPAAAITVAAAALLVGAVVVQFTLRPSLQTAAAAA